MDLIVDGTGSKQKFWPNLWELTGFGSSCVIFKADKIQIHFECDVGPKKLGRFVKSKLLLDCSVGPIYFEH